MEIYLGKTVIYEPSGGMQYRGMKLVAIVTRVYENERVNLAIFDPTGNIMQNPPTNIGIDQLSEAAPEVHAGDCLCGRCVNNRSMAPSTMPNSAEQFGVPPMGGVPNIPFDKSELPAGARMVEHRPATPEEIEAAKAGIGVPKVKSPKKPVKKPVRKPKSPRKPKGY
jgi:hypothetical protein